MEEFRNKTPQIVPLTSDADNKTLDFSICTTIANLNSIFFLYSFA